MKPQPMSSKQHRPEQPHDFGQFQDLFEFAMNPISHSVAFLEFIGTFIYNILRIACVPAELIFRRNFGERHFNLYLYIGGSLWLGIFATGWLNLPAAMGFKITPLISNGVIFSVIAVVFYVRMFWQLFFRRSGEIDTELHTRYDGDPLTLLNKAPLAKDRSGLPREYFIRQLIEPIFLIVLGIVVTVILNPQTGTWLILSAFCMALKEYVKARYVRNLLLDQVDAAIVAKHLSGAMKGESPKNTQGVYIAGLPTDGKKREQLNHLMQRSGERFTAEAVH